VACREAIGARYPRAVGRVDSRWVGGTPLADYTGNADRDETADAAGAREMKEVARGV